MGFCNFSKKKPLILFQKKKYTNKQEGKKIRMNQIREREEITN